MVKATATYEEALKGRHPDMGDRRFDDPREAVMLAVTLLLRDKFTPLCIEFASAVRAMDASQIVSISIGSGNVRTIDHSDHGLHPESMATIATGKFDRSYVLDHPVDFNGKKNWMLTVNSPIGPYGFDAARNLAHTAAIMIMFAGRFYSRAIALKRENPELIYETAMANPFFSLRDGVISIVNSFSLMMAESVQGSADAHMHVERLAQTSLPNQLSQVIPSGFIQPIVRSGLYVPGLVIVKDGNKLRLNPDFVRKMGYIRKETKELYGAKKGSTERGGYLSFGCPVGKRIPEDTTTGIQEMTDAFLHVFRIVEEATYISPLPQTFPNLAFP